MTIKNWMCGSYRGTQGDLLIDPDFMKLARLYNHLEDKGYCYIKLSEGDYAGSVAKFTVDRDFFKGRKLYSQNWGDNYYHFTSYFSGRLSWKGKRNNPKFLLRSGTVEEVYLCSNMETVFKKLDFTKIKKELLEQGVYDIDGEELSLGDDVLYMNLRYGCGGKLCKGAIQEFKPHAREGYVSVVIQQANSEEISNCNHPHMQIYKL